MPRHQSVATLWFVTELTYGAWLHAAQHFRENRTSKLRADIWHRRSRHCRIVSRGLHQHNITCSCVNRHFKISLGGDARAIHRPQYPVHRGRAASHTTKGNDRTSKKRISIRNFPPLLLAFGHTHISIQSRGLFFHAETSLLGTSQSTIN